MSAKLDDILRKVQALIAQADHPNTSPVEAETFRAKAEALMFKYRIDETQLSAEERTAQAITVTWTTIRLCNVDSEFRDTYYSLFLSMVNHLDVRCDVGFVHEEGVSYYEAQVCGYESDLAFVSMLYTAAALSFSQRLEPKYDPTLSDQVNAYLMRSAGMEGHRIAMAIYGRDDKALRPKVRAMFKAEAIARGEDPTPLLGKGVNVKLFRESYAQGFRNTISDRLYRMRASRAQVETGLVLAGRKEAIDEAFYERFPHYRPRPSKGAIGDGYETCAKCAKAKSGACNDHPWRRARKARVRYANAAGLARGRDAARSVDLGVTGREIR